MTSGIKVRFPCAAKMLSKITTTAQDNTVENQGKTKKASSKDAMSSLKQWWATVELTMEKLVNKIVNSEGCIEELGEEHQREM